MQRARIHRFASVLGGAALLVALLPGLASAAPPNWTMDIERQPEVVQNGSLAGFVITIDNTGPSNIAALYFVDSPVGVPDFLQSTRSGCSTSSGDLLCSFGALTPDDPPIVLTVAYLTPSTGSSYSYSGQLNSTGSTFSDAKGRSRGDALSVSVTTTLSSGRHSAGGFLITADQEVDVANDTNLHPSKNRQSTELLSLGGGLGAFVQDGPGVSANCGDFCLSSYYGEWSRIIVDAGHVQGQPFAVRVTVIGNFKQADADAALYTHVLDDGVTVVTIGDAADEKDCSATDPDLDDGGFPSDGCLYASVLPSGNLQFVVWLTQNGWGRG